MTQQKKRIYYTSVRTRYIEPKTCPIFDTERQTNSSNRGHIVSCIIPNFKKSDTYYMGIKV